MKRIILATLFFVLTAGTGHAGVLQDFSEDILQNHTGQFEGCESYYEVYRGPYGGYSTVIGQLCGRVFTGTLTYHSWRESNLIMLNGYTSVSFVVDSAYYPTAVTYIYNGGIIEYNIIGTVFSVIFSDYRVYCAITSYGIMAVAETGGVYINGYYFPADSSLSGYIF